MSIEGLLRSPSLKYSRIIDIPVVEENPPLVLVRLWAQMYFVVQVLGTRGSYLQEVVFEVFDQTRLIFIDHDGCGGVPRDHVHETILHSARFNQLLDLRCNVPN